MIPVQKLMRVQGTSRLRKALLVLETIQRSAMSGTVDSLHIEWTLRFASSLMDAEVQSGDRHGLVTLCRTFLDSRNQDLASRPFLRALDAFRHGIAQVAGHSFADWDLINPATGTLDGAARKAFPGMNLYCEDIRSPFNLGSIFRSAEALGVARLILSPGCADPYHPRCLRSAMGALSAPAAAPASGTDSVLPWHREQLSSHDPVTRGPLFGLELGGESITTFRFPETGTAIIGSEELGLSPEARALCGNRIVTIPMAGAKGSLNVAVATGILLAAWAQQLRQNRPPDS